MLDGKQMDGIKKLQIACEQEESIQLKLNWGMLKTRKEKEKMDFLHYENDLLVGFVGIYGFGSKVELCGMVHPSHRRKGIFKQLLADAFIEINNGKTKQILLNAPAKSFSGKGFLQTIPCSLSFSEHQMKWSERAIEDIEDVIIRSSTPDDLETEIQLDVKCFDFLEEEAKDYNHRIKQETQDYYMIEADQQTVGKIRVQQMNGEAWIYGFAILPEYQGQGIGRKALKKVIKEEHQKGYSIFLEVEATNSHALGLYESCGFKAINSQDYYVYDRVI